MIQLVKANEIRPSTYNPRETDPVRLDYIELSLRKLGFLLPLYVDGAGEILSGHQRHLVATERLGCRFVPVETVRPEDSIGLDLRKGLNILFNRATNDFCFFDTPRTATNELHQSGALEEIRNLPDIPVGSEAFFPCIHAMMTKSIKPILETNDFTNAQDSRNLAKSLLRYGVLMPVIAKEDGKVINGIGRLMLQAELGREEIDVITVPEDRARIIHFLINRLSMEFNLHERYSDVLRYNSFSRKRSSRQSLGRGFYFLISDTSSNQFDINIPENLATWKQTYGDCVLNFGAGHMTESEILRRNGAYVTSFEPYVLAEKDAIDKRRSIDVTRMFLRDVGARRVWDSIFINQVFNSVPFWQDRLHIVTLLAALSTRDTTVYARATSDKCGISPTAEWKSMDRNKMKSVKMIAEYEKGVTIGEYVTGRPKMQKYHSVEEFEKLFQSGFENCNCEEDVGPKGQVVAICSDPRPISLKKLRAAIEFEFDLPYPDGSTMDLVAEAKEAFGRRLGVKL